MSEKKKYCYKSECSFVETGFRLDFFTVCTVCHEEVSDTLRERKTEEQEAERKRLEREAKKREEDEDPYKVWHYL